MRWLAFLLLLTIAAPAVAEVDYAARLAEGDAVLRDFRFQSGETPARIAHPLCDARDAASRRRRRRSTMR